MGFEVLSQVCSIGNINANSITKLEIKNQTNAMKLTNCMDEVAAEKMYNLIKTTSEMGDSIGSSVEVSIKDFQWGGGAMVRWFRACTSKGIDGNSCSKGNRIW